MVRGCVGIRDVYLGFEVLVGGLGGIGIKGEGFRFMGLVKEDREGLF